MSQAGFAYTDRDSVTVLLKNGSRLPEWKTELIDKYLVIVSARLSAWFPTLKSRWLNADPEDPIVDFIPAIVAEAVKKVADNPDGMSSETMGPYAYSRYESQDVFKTLFNDKDLKALEALLDESQSAGGAVIMRYTNTYPAAPMPGPGRYTNSRKWPRGRGLRGNRWRDRGVW